VGLEVGLLFVAEIESPPCVTEACPHELVSGLAVRFWRLSNLECHAVQRCQDLFQDLLFASGRWFGHLLCLLWPQVSGVKFVILMFSIPSMKTSPHDSQAHWQPVSRWPRLGRSHP